jgi:hypothetical protein
MQSSADLANDLNDIITGGRPFYSGDNLNTFVSDMLYEISGSFELEDSDAESESETEITEPSETDLDDDIDTKNMDKKINQKISIDGGKKSKLKQEFDIHESKEDLENESKPPENEPAEESDKEESDKEESDKEESDKEESDKETPENETEFPKKEENESATESEMKESEPEPESPKKEKSEESDTEELDAEESKYIAKNSDSAIIEELVETEEKEETPKETIEETTFEETKTEKDAMEKLALQQEKQELEEETQSVITPQATASKRGKTHRKSKKTGSDESSPLENPATLDEFISSNNNTETDLNELSPYVVEITEVTPLEPEKKGAYEPTNSCQCADDIRNFLTEFTSKIEL